MRSLGRSYGFDAFEEFRCPESVHPVVFAQLCSHYHQSKLLDSSGTEVSSNLINVSSSGINSSEAKKKSLIQVRITSWAKYG